MKYKCAGVFCVVIVLSGCGEQPEPTGVIPQYQLDALDKAKKVEGLLQQKGKNLEKALEE